jgi:hypothetical protein
MVSQWFNESDFNKYIYQYPELKKEIEDYTLSWVYEFDTVENRKIIDSGIKSIVSSHVSRLRDKKIDSILDDKKSI